VKKLKKGTLFRTIAAAIAALCPLIATAQSGTAFPHKRVTIIVPFTPGGPTDIQGRMLAAELQKRWTQPVTVENKPGSSGMVAGQSVAKSDPDGHTLFFTATGFVSTASVFIKNPPFDPVRDFAPITLTSSAPFVVTTVTAIPPRNMKDFISYAKANPGKLNYATIGGGTMEIDLALFVERLGLDMIKVPFNGSAPIARALATNDVQLYFSGIFSNKALVDAGKVVLLATTGDRRFSLAPDLPALREQGINYTATYAYGFLAQGRTPRAIVDRLNRDIRQVVEIPEMKQKISESGTEATTSTPEEMSKMLEDEAQRYRQGAARAGIQPQ